MPNVHEFPGHIACSSKTNSEIVVPLVKSDGVRAASGGGTRGESVRRTEPPLCMRRCCWDASQALIGVLDLDAMNLNGFDEEDQKGLETIAKFIVEACDWPAW